MSSMFWISFWRLLTKLSILCSGFFGDSLFMVENNGLFLKRSVWYFAISSVIFLEFLLASMAGFLFT